MLVEHWMTRNVVTAGLEMTVIDAAETMRRKNIRQMPVVDASGAVVGIVSDRDTRDAMPSKYLPGDAAGKGGFGLAALKVKDIMTPDPVCVAPDTAMDATAQLIIRNKIGGLPVLEGGKLAGIITLMDVLRFLCSATGVARGGPQFAFRLEAKPGPLAALLDDLRARGLRILSVLTCYDHVEAGHRHAYIRLQDTGTATLEELTQDLRSRYDLLFRIADGETVRCA